MTVILFICMHGHASERFLPIQAYEAVVENEANQTGVSWYLYFLYCFPSPPKSLSEMMVLLAAYHLSLK